MLDDDKEDADAIDWLDGGWMDGDKTELMGSGRNESKGSLGQFLNRKGLYLNVSSD